MRFQRKSGSFYVSPANAKRVEELNKEFLTHFCDPWLFLVRFAERHGLELLNSCAKTQVNANRGLTVGWSHFDSMKAAPGTWLPKAATWLTVAWVLAATHFLLG